MINKDQALSDLKTALNASTADQTELCLIGEELSLTRFAESQIHQNMYRADTTVFVRAIKDKKIGITSTGDLSPEALKKAVIDACTIATLMPADADFDSLPTPQMAPTVTTNALDGDENSPQQRADAVGKVVELCRKSGLQTAGAYRVTTESVAVVNSLGVEQFGASSRSELSLTANGEKGNAGWAIAYDHDSKMINPELVAGRAIDKASRSLDPIAIESGAYTVILEPAAVGQLLLFLAFMGFGAKTLYQQRSFMAGKIGEKITGDNITIIEDPLAPEFSSLPFDYEGVPRKRVVLIENGIARGAVSNSYYAKLLNAESSGHALPPNNTYGPYPKHMAIAAGNSSIDEMVASTTRGVYITHFWYVNFLNPMKTQVTGTTRDGTFLIENGKIGKAINNMRINQSILDAFAAAEKISSVRELYPQYSVAMLVPAMKINNFNLEATEG
ncbi:MAG: TldD/PmbA family protein [Candidatus Zixiibacteriota bacterium]